MFYVGNILYLEKTESFLDIPNLNTFSGGAFYLNRIEHWFENGKYQSPQDPITGEWLPACVYPLTGKHWYDNDLLHSFRNPITGKLMPAIAYAGGVKYYYDHGEQIYPHEDED